jgi:hypothetical protein
LNVVTRAALETLIENVAPCGVIFWKYSVDPLRLVMSLKMTRRSPSGPR